MKLETQIDKISYIIGEDIGNSILKEGYDFNLSVLLEAIKMAAEGKSENLMTEAEKNNVMQKWQAEQQAKKQSQIAEQSRQARKQGEDFLRNNRLQPNVTETPSGLQYTVLQEGVGQKPLSTDKVRVHYHGTLLNGTVFDSSVQRGESIVFPLNQVIAGWTEGVQLMNVGSKYRFYIPADLAYGDQPVGNIPAGSTLIFEVELLGIE
ncbi:MAG: FKBP-type peptidyl-prolyl cis-trans isomerase [Bacteroidales bacterium]|nr:FKBP-type peptidyl-prolyl cis-trans isomerase [Bacteroidales bacterium]MBQ9311891.1 FKBP-type peptidyl-prolyl cis-trans isomerase [Bacteroidales bacterium]